MRAPLLVSLITVLSAVCPKPTLGRTNYLTVAENNIRINILFQPSSTGVITAPRDARAPVVERGQEPARDERPKKVQTENKYFMFETLRSRVTLV